MAWVLSLGAGAEQIPLLRAIKHEGHKVVAVDRNQDAPGVPMCDAFSPISNREPDAIIEYARWVGAEAVIVAASEVADVAAIVAHEFGMPGVSVATALTCKDKLLQKKCYTAAGVPHTEARSIYRGSAKSTFDDLKYKVVVKPQRGSGSRGVAYVDNPMELPIALQAAEEVCPDVLMERYQPGPQLSVEALVWDGIAVTVACVDRFYPAGRPCFKEIGGSMPSAYPEHLREVDELVMAAASALGIHSGSLKLDVVLTATGPKIIEATPRLSGGPLASIVYDSTGVDYLRQAVRIAVGEKPSFEALCPRMNINIARHMDGREMPWDESRQYVVKL